MKFPNLSEEKKLWRQGYKIVVGLDEAGRGPLAGPVVAAAVTIRIPDFKNWNLFRDSNFEFRISEVRDSKQLSPSHRERIYKKLVRSPRLRWGIGVVSNKIIDRINILEATKLAMVKALGNLNHKLPKARDRGKIVNLRKIKLNKLPKTSDRVNSVSLNSSFLILDGKMELPLPLAQKSMVKADEKVFSCAEASIIAKVTRDRLMAKYHQKYPRYHFDQHKGYPTRLHLKMLRKYGPSKIHRLSFRPVLEVQSSKRKAKNHSVKLKAIEKNRGFAILE